MKKVTIYTDGGCRGNGEENAIGGYGIVLFYGETKKEVKLARRGVTNNIMELSSVIDALNMLKESCEIQLYSDSKYVTDAINQKWLDSWRKNNWVKSNKEKVKNKELWLNLIPLLEKHKIKFNWVKGHSSNEYNNRCDELANEAMDELIAKEKQNG